VNEQENTKLTEFFESALDKINVKSVKISKKLTSSPICLVADEKAMDIKLERFLLEQKQIAAPLARILEINPNHSIIKYINKNIGNEGEKENLKDIIKTLYDEACIMEGEPVSNPTEFAKRLNKMLEITLNSDDKNI
jgi:molecular chaperone HtpG